MALHRAPHAFNHSPAPHPTIPQRAPMEAVEADIVAAVGGGELTVDRVRAEVRALSEGIAAKQVCGWGVMLR